MNDLLRNRQMEGVSPLDQAKRAIAHTLRVISEDRHKYELMGLGTQSFALLTEAAATLFERPVHEVREKFLAVANAEEDAPL